MPRFKTALLASVFVAASASSVFAADLPAAPPEAPVHVPPAFSWTGLYVGAHAGYAWGNSDWTYLFNDAKTDQDVDGFLAGGQIGYNYQFSNGLVLGAEVSASSGGVSGDDGCPIAEFTCNTDVNWLADARLRLGYGFDRFLVYAAGGIAFAGAEFEDNLGWEGDESLVGWTVGAGVAYALTENLSVGLEYNYISFDEDNVDFHSPNGVLNEPFDLELDSHVVKARLDYRFAW